MRGLARFVLGRPKPIIGPDAPYSGPVRVVLFDFDGTLANTLADGLEILNELSGEFGFRRLEGDEIEQARDMTTRQVMRFLDVPSRKLPTIAHRGIKRLRSRMDRIQPFAEVPDMLKELTAMGLRLGIVTSNSEENVAVFLRNHGIGEFQFIRSSSRLLGKARVIRQAMKEFKFTAGESIFVGDETRDIEACRRAGMRCVAVTWGYNSQKALVGQAPYRVVHTPGEIPPLVVAAGIA